MNGQARILAGLLAATLAATPALGQLRPDGPEITLTDVGENLTLDTDAEGRTIVGWSTEISFSADDIYAQRFGTTGLPIGGPLLVATKNLTSFWTDFPFMSSLGAALTGNGEFVVAWEGGQQHDADGTLMGTFAPTRASVRFPRLAGRSGGDFVATWSYGIPGDTEDFFLQSFDPDASPIAPSLDSEFLPFGWESVYSEVRTNSSGDLLVALLGVYWVMELHAYDPAGIERGSTQLSDVLRWGGQHIALAEDGSFVVAWYNNETPILHQFQRFAPDATPLGPVVPISGVLPFAPIGLAVAHDGTREFVVVWDNLDNSEASLKAQRFSAAGEPVGIPFEIATPGGKCFGIAADMDAGGNLTVGWMHTEDVGPFNIRVRRFCGPLRISAPQSQAACAGSPVSFDASATGRAPFSLQWRRDGVPLSDGGGVSGTSTGSLAIDAVSVADSGAYDLSVTDSCFTPENAASAAAQLAVFDGPQTQAVPDLLVNLDPGGSALNFNWTDVAGTADYAIYADTAPDGPFTTLTGVGASGAAGLTVPVPGGSVFYLAVARSPCGDGPLR